MKEIITKKKETVFEDSFKLEMIQLYNSGTSRVQMVKKSDLTSSSLGKRIKQYSSNQSFKLVDNLTEQDKAIIRFKQKLCVKEI